MLISECEFKCVLSEPSTELAQNQPSLLSLLLLSHFRRLLPQNYPQVWMKPVLVLCFLSIYHVLSFNVNLPKKIVHSHFTSPHCSFEYNHHLC